MSALAILNMLLLTVEVALASLVLPAVGWLLARSYRKRAAGRRLVWVVVFAILLALPLLALALPGGAVIALPAPSSADPSLAEAAATAPPEPSHFSWAVLIPVAGAVWIAGLAKIAVEHLVAAARLERMRRRATPWPDPTPAAVRGCALLMSEDCPGPMTWGVARPVIMLPDEALDWPADRLETVLRHEMAHVRRRDGLAQALAVVACALYWPNPLVWAAARALRREVELAADDAVIAAGVKPSDYASQLLELAAEWRERRLTPTGLAMAAPPALSRRVQSILSTDAIRTGATAMDTFKLVLLGGAATAALLLARPSLAEVAPPPSAPADPQAQQAPPAAPPAQAAPAAPSAATMRSRVNAAVPSDRALKLAQQDAPAPPAAAAKPPAPAAAATGPWARAWIADPNGAPASAAPPAPAQPAAAPPAAFPPLPPQPPTTAEQRRPRLVFGVDHDQDDQLTPEERAELNRQLAAIGPRIEKALADAHIDEAVAQALKDAHIDETVDKAVKGIQPRIQKAIADAQVRAIVAQRLAAVDAAVVRAQEDARRAEEQAREAAEKAKRAQDEVAKGANAP